MKDKKEDFRGFNRREVIYLGGVGMAAITLAGFPQLGHGAEKKPKYGGRLRIGERWNSTGLDSHKNQFFIDFCHYTLMYNALTIMGPLPDPKMYPDLAKSWEISKDGKEYIFLLREGVKFHHGKELDSGDVKYSIERVMDPATRSPRSFAFKWVDSVNAVDKYHVKIKLKEPFGPFLTSLTIQTCPVIPKDWEPTGIKPAPGTGPFVFKSVIPNETTELSRFDKYWEVDENTGDRLPYLDSIYTKKIVDETSRWTALRAGDLDYIAAPPANVVVKELEKPTPGIVIPTPRPLGGVWVFFNVTKPPFDNKKVRQAIAYAVDKEEVEKAALWGLGVIMNNQFFLEGSDWYVPIKDRAVDLAKAKQLLTEAGYPNGFKTELLQYSVFPVTDACSVILGQLKKIGIEGTIKMIDRAPYYVSMPKGDYGMSLMQESVRLDPDDAYYYTMHSGQIGTNNWSRYSNKEMDRLLESGRTAWKREDRLPYYKKAVEIIKEDLPILYLSRTKTALAHKDYLKGFKAGAGTWWGYYGGGFKEAWLDR
jgi:peptide/nickel transport system substrate-binding protein